MPVSQARSLAQPPASPIAPRSLKQARLRRRCWLRGEAGVRVLARIPDVSVEGPAPEPTPAVAPRAHMPVRPSTATCGGRTTGWAAWPVAALAVIAAVTWLLASRNEQARLERQRSEVRMAREPVGVAAPTGAATGGAVVR